MLFVFNKRRGEWGWERGREELEEAEGREPVIGIKYMRKKY